MTASSNKPQYLPDFKKHGIFFWGGGWPGGSGGWSTVEHHAPKAKGHRFDPHMGQCAVPSTAKTEQRLSGAGLL